MAKNSGGAGGISVHQWLDRLAEKRPAGVDGLTILPYFLGEKTPIHDANARGMIDGLTLSHDVGHLWRAMLEAYAYAIATTSKCSTRSATGPRGLSSRTAARRAASGCRSSRMCCKGRCSDSPATPDHASASPGRPRSALASHPIGLRSPLSSAPPIGSSLDLESPISTAAAIAAIATSIAAWPIVPSSSRHEPLSRGRLGHRRHADRQRAACIERALVDASAALGADLSDLDADAFRGIHAIDIWKALKPRFPPGSVDQDMDRGDRADYVAHAGELEPIPGAIEAMRALAARGVAQACVSNSGRRIVDANIKALGIRRDDRVLDQPRRRLRGQARSRALSRGRAALGAAAEAVVAVEDSGAGARSARAAGLYRGRLFALGRALRRRRSIDREA